MSSQIRCLLLQGISLSLLFTLGKIVLDPVSGKRPFADFKFPEVIPLAGWKLVNSQPSADRASTIAQYNRISTGRQYEYRQNRSVLRVEIRYVLNTDGDVMKLLKEQPQEYHLMQQISNLQQSYTTSGFYSSFTISDTTANPTVKQLHLTSCINPRGSSTITSEQFFHNRYIYDLQPKRLFIWALGQENLIDQRCLWLHLSTPIQDNNPDQARSMLENAWRSLTVWGQTQFPKP
jgi:cyanosortase A-associated protein